MLDIKFIKENRELVENAIKNKKVKQEIDLDKLLELSDKKNDLQKQLEDLNQKRNQAAKEQDIEKGKQYKQEASEIESQLQEIDKEYLQIMIAIPNIPSADTPVGEDESGNQVVRQWGEKPQFDFEPKAHWDLGRELGIIDNETAAKVSGSRFTYIKGDLALMQFAIIQYGLSILTNKEKLKEIADKAGLEVDTTPFTFVLPPDMVKPAVLNRMGRLEPKEDRYYLQEDDLYLAGSAEHALGPMHMDETFSEKDLPKRYVGYTTSFRREAGSYGKDTKGIIRVHQFDKMEMETFCLPEKSHTEQEFMVAIQEHVMQELQLPYQVVMICTGDMGIPDYRQIDIETWMAGQDTYKETHTSDSMTSFQSRRLNTRVKREDGNSEFVHMNDATLFSMRPLIAIIENNQQSDGTIKIPEALRPYMGGKEFIGK
jgi:seryl-tRNA synthetase